MRKVTITDVENTLDFCKKRYSELANIELSKSDIRCGKRIALVKKNDGGGIDLKTDFMEYREMECFLNGYISAKESRI